MTYLLAIAAATLLRAVAIAATVARATVVWLRLLAQATAGIATSELGLGFSGQFRLSSHDLAILRGRVNSVESENHFD